jgi:hypothetical protein
MDRPTVIDDDDDYAPMPYHSAEFEDSDERVKQRAAAAAPKARSPGVVSSSIINNIIQQKSAHQQHSVNQNDVDEEALQLDNHGRDETFDTNSQQSNVSNNENTGMVDLDSSLQVIPHAYLVDDDDDEGDGIVVAGYAEPLLPWWQQRRTRILLGIVIILLIAAAAAIGTSETKRRNALSRTLSPTQSRAPSSSPSMAPSVSLAPSTSPTKCSDTITANAKEVDLNILIGGLKSPKAAIDGNNMVVVAKDSTGYAYTIFFKRGNNWE